MTVRDLASHFIDTAFESIDLPLQKPTNLFAKQVPLVPITILTDRLIINI